MTTHDHPTKTIKASDLDAPHVLVGECGGLSAVLGRDDVHIITEHGTLSLDPHTEVEVYDDQVNPDDLESLRNIMWGETEDRTDQFDSTCVHCGEGIDYISGEYWGTEPNGDPSCLSGPDGWHKPKEGS